MHAMRRTEVNVLGYRIDRVRAAAAAGIETGEDWHEVLCPDSGDVLGRFANRPDAERFIIERELAGARAALARNVA